MAEPIDKKILKTFVPADALKAENFQELASKTFLEPVAAGKVIFKKEIMTKKRFMLWRGRLKYHQVLLKIVMSQHQQVTL
jgi:hypothetical protein